MFLLRLQAITSLNDVQNAALLTQCLWAERAGIMNKVTGIQWEQDPFPQKGWK